MIPGVSIPMLVSLEAEKVFEVTLSNSSVGANISALFSGPDWASIVKKRVIIPAGVTRGSSVLATPVLRTGTGRGGSLEIVLNGDLDGAGGAANGGGGGDCLLIEQSGVTLTGTGRLRPGGSGGGKGGDGSIGGITYQPGPGTSNFTLDYGTYGIWYLEDPGPHMVWNNVFVGYPTSTSISSNVYVGTFGGWDYYKDGGSFFEGVGLRRQQGGTVATPGGDGGVGQGHGQARTDGVAGGTNAGAGGNGGDWGADGTAGANGTVTNGAAAGLRGCAINGIANLTDLFTGTKLGRTI